jgi:hypothetical protein
MFLIIKKRGAYIFFMLKVQKIQFWAVPNMFNVYIKILATPNPGIVITEFSIYTKFAFITKTNTLKECSPFSFRPIQSIKSSYVAICVYDGLQH